MFEFLGVGFAVILGIASIITGGCLSMVLFGFTGRASALVPGFIFIGLGIGVLVMTGYSLPFTITITR